LFFLFLVSFSLFAQQEGKPGCGTLPIEDAYLKDPFYGKNLENYQSSIYFIQLTTDTSNVVKRLILNK
jgi:hypothetical protein